MDRVQRLLEALKLMWRYAPLVWFAIKSLFALWKARLQHKAAKDALEKERLRRVEAERQLDIRGALAGDFDARRDRALRDAVAREISRRGKDGHDDNGPDR